MVAIPSRHKAVALLAAVLVAATAVAGGADQAGFARTADSRLGGNRGFALRT